NNNFKEFVYKDENEFLGKNLKDIFGKDTHEFGAKQGTVLEFNNKFYQCYSVKSEVDVISLYMIYFVDISFLQQNYEISKKKQPVVMSILIDNYDDIVSTEENRGDSKIISDAREVIQNFVAETSGFLKKLEKDRYIMVFEKQNLDKMITTRFNVLDKARVITNSARVPITFSMGIAVVDDTLVKAERESQQALEMALGRGGDQAVIKTQNGYEFFGGYSKGIEKRTKVKTRIVASAMVELFNSANDIMVMGHRFADLDSLGSAIGMAKAIRCFGKNVHIVIDTKRNLVQNMLQKLYEVEGDGIVMEPEDAVAVAGANTLLIVCDTHTKALVQSPELLEKCNQIIVIDHHRKVVNHIDNAVIFYHEPYASSACEMVSELVQYFGDKCKLTYYEAESLLSGIMLDTKNFTIKAGVRTFEAAAYLRRLGADPIEVRKLFTSSIESYQRRTRIVSSAEIYSNCAIAICDFYSEDLRIIAPQAADELLGISGVKASFVLYEAGEVINVSARSMGELNVQIVMEALGGGGHHTMAGAQIKNSSYDKVRQSLLEVIDKVQRDKDNKEE
ncbi:MAG: DHH family phosphoesterase, partial [Oscillospiraceae bacterium]